MKDIEISSFSEYVNYIDKNYNSNFLFRGVNSLDYKLIPKIGRSSYTAHFSSDKKELLNKLQDLEEKTMHDFINMAIPHLDMRQMNSWDQWTIGQHYGLPTRFLDWTENPLIAAYFATERVHKDQVAVYVTERNQFNKSTSDIDDPFSAEDEVLLHIPSYINARIISQKGVFTVHKDPTVPINETTIDGKVCEVDRLIINSKAVQEFVDNLDWFGINRSFIYPGLDGLAHYLDLQASTKGGIT